MKIVYCIPSVYNSGGMERILSIKANYLADIKGYDVTIITTDQKNRGSFFRFSDKIKFYDLGINYSDNDICCNPLSLLIRIFRLRKHKKRLSFVLSQIKPDICISMFQHEASFLPSIKDGSYKIIESHFCRYYRLLSGKGIIRRSISKLRMYLDNKIIRSFDVFVTLTDEDRLDWPAYDNIMVIPNPITIRAQRRSRLNHKNVLAIGRVTYQKGFDSLVRAWSLIQGKHLDWGLTILGAQDDAKYLCYLRDLIEESGSTTITLQTPTKDIEEEYLNSDILVMTSVYEGLPLVLLEGMSIGLPAVSFACKCGPRDIIEDGKNGFLVTPGDYEAFAARLERLIVDKDLLQEMSDAALKKSHAYDIDEIMEKWIILFNKLSAIDD